MLEEEHKFQRSVDYTLKMLQVSNWLLFSLSALITIFLIFSLQIGTNFIKSLTFIFSMCLFICLFSYSAYNLRYSLHDICFHLVLVTIFLFFQIFALLGMLVNFSSFERMLKSNSLTILNQYRYLMYFIVLTNFVATVIFI